MEAENLFPVRESPEKPNTLVLRFKIPLPGRHGTTFAQGSRNNRALHSPDGRLTLALIPQRPPWTIQARIGRPLEFKKDHSLHTCSLYSPSQFPPGIPFLPSLHSINNIFTYQSHR